MIKEIGWKQPLYILPFDHRNTFSKELFSSTRILNEYQIDKIKEVKQIIYEAFLMSLDRGMPKEYAAILVDEQYGDKIIKDAILRSINVCLSVEKSGQLEFDFEYGSDFATHIQKYNPTFCKVLVRYNPESNPEINKRQLQKLAVLNNFCKANNYKFLAEILIPPTDRQLKDLNNDLMQYEMSLRPKLTVRTIFEMQNSEVEPDIWKIEGMYGSQDYNNVVKQAKAGIREHVGIIVLGKGDSREHVEKWISTGAGVEGVIGFAVGRTVFLKSIKEFVKETIDKEMCIRKICADFMYFYNLFESSKKSSQG